MDTVQLIFPFLMCLSVIGLVGYLVIVAIPRILDIHTRELQNQRASYTEMITRDMAKVETALNEVMKTADAAWHGIERHDYAATQRHEDMMAKLRAVEQVAVNCVKHAKTGGGS